MGLKDIGMMCYGWRADGDVRWESERGEGGRGVNHVCVCVRVCVCVQCHIVYCYKQAF